MSNTFTLSSVKAAAERKYAPVQVDLSDAEDGSDLVTLTPVLRLSKVRRRELEALQKVREDSKSTSLDDLEQFLRNYLSVVVDNKAAAKKLLDVVGEDIPFMAELVREYSERTTPGEASSSES